jgi:hypothetical protein
MAQNTMRFLALSSWGPKMRITLFSATYRLVLEAAEDTVVLSPDRIEVRAPAPLDGRMTVEAWQIAELATAGFHPGLADLGLRLILMDVAESTKQILDASLQAALQKTNRSLLRGSTATDRARRARVPRPAWRPRNKAGGR